MKAVALLVPTLLLAACATTGPGSPASGASPADPGAPPATPPAQAATVVLAPASGSLVSGRVEAMAMDGGLHFMGEVGGLAPDSRHGLHVHERGDCSAADASSAGGHYNPAGTAHGGPETTARHAGDLGNVTADARGVARIDVHAPGLRLGGGGAGDVAGRALVLHADADDLRSQPSGNSGARVACGLIAPRR